MGTSKRTLQNMKKVQDHPHAYGDKAEAFFKSVQGLGSSPRVWGQANLTDFKVGLEGIIPTRMGTRLAPAVNPNQPEDHPHAYGDKFMQPFFKTSDIGSSPRVWGQVSFAVAFFDSLRIIPTRMGTSFNGGATCYLM